MNNGVINTQQGSAPKSLAELNAELFSREMDRDSVIRDLDIWRALRDDISILQGMAKRVDELERRQSTEDALPRQNTGNAVSRAFSLLAELLAEGATLRVSVQHGDLTAQLSIVRSIEKEPPPVSESQRVYDDAQLPTTNHSAASHSRADAEQLPSSEAEKTPAPEPAQECGRRSRQRRAAATTQTKREDDAAELPKGHQLLVLGSIVHTHRGYSMSEILCRMKSEPESEIKIAVQQLVHAGWLLNIKGVYWIPAEYKQYSRTDVEETPAPETGESPATEPAQTSPRPMSLREQRAAATRNAEEARKKVEEALSSTERTILDLLRATKLHLSMGQLLGRFPADQESDVRVAVQRLKQSGLIELDGGLYSAARK